MNLFIIFSCFRKKFKEILLFTNRAYRDESQLWCVCGAAKRIHQSLVAKSVIMSFASRNVACGWRFRVGKKSSVVSWANMLLSSPYLQWGILVYTALIMLTCSLLLVRVPSRKGTFPVSRAETCFHVCFFVTGLTRFLRILGRTFFQLFLWKDLWGKPCCYNYLHVIFALNWGRNIICKRNMNSNSSSQIWHRRTPPINSTRILKRTECYGDNSDSGL